MTPNTGYWMPDYAYYDWLQERGWCVDELRECEEWCYPFGHWVEMSSGSLGDGVYGRHRGIFDLGCTYCVERGLGCAMRLGCAMGSCFGARVMSLLGNGRGGDWWLYQ